MKGTFDFRKMKSSAVFGAIMSLIIVAFAFFPLITGGDKSGALIFALCIIPVGVIPALISFIPYFRAKNSSFEADDCKITYRNKEFQLDSIEAVFTTVSRYGSDLVITFRDDKTAPVSVPCLTNADELVKYISFRIPAGDGNFDFEPLKKRLRIFEIAMTAYFLILVVCIIFVLVFLLGKNAVFPDARVIGFGICALIAAIILFFTARRTVILSNKLNGKKFALRRSKAGELPIDGKVVRVYADHGFYSRFIVYGTGEAFFCVVQLISDSGDYSEMYRSGAETDITSLEKVIGTDGLMLIYDDSDDGENV